MIIYRYNMKKTLIFISFKKGGKAFKYVYEYILDVKNEGWEV